MRLCQSQGRTRVSWLPDSSRQSPGSSGFVGPVGHLRARLHLDGADLAEAALHDAGALHEEFAALALEALLLPHRDLVLPQGIHGFAAGHAGRSAAGRAPHITQGSCPPSAPLSPCRLPPNPGCCPHTSRAIGPSPSQAGTGDPSHSPSLGAVGSLVTHKWQGPSQRLISPCDVTGSASVSLLPSPLP